MEQFLLDAAGILHADHHVGQQPLEHPGRCEVVGRADLPEVRGNGFLAFRTVDAESGHVGLAMREDVVPDPGHGQVAQGFLRLGKTVEFDTVAGGDDDVVVGEDHALRLARSAGSVEKNPDIGTPALVDGIVQQFRFPGQGFPTQVLDHGEIMQLRLVIFPQSPRIVVDDLIECLNALTHFEHLVHLFLILGQDKTHAGMIEDELHFLGDGIGIYRHRDTAQALSGRDAPVQSRSITANDGELVTGGEPQLPESGGECEHLLLDLLPGPGLPDSIFLFPDRGAVTESLGVENQELGKCIGGARNSVRHLVMVFERSLS